MQSIVSYILSLVPQSSANDLNVSYQQMRLPLKM